MLRRAFLRRMALAAAACAFIDVPWPKPKRKPFIAYDTVLTIDGVDYPLGNIDLHERPWSEVRVVHD